MSARIHAWVVMARRLHALGHAPEFTNADDHFLGWARTDGRAKLVARYQAFHGLPVTGEVDGAMAQHMTAPRCGHPDVMADSAQCQWPIKDLHYWQAIVYQGVDPAQIAAEYAEAWRRWTVVCDITAAPAAEAAAAQVLAQSAPIDGQWNILALTELPCGFTASDVAHQTFDVAETELTSEQRIACMCHELGHALGLGHELPGSGNLMEPMLSAIGSPQAGDTAKVQVRYGAPTGRAALPGPAPAPAPAAPPPNGLDPAELPIDFQIAEPGHYRISRDPSTGNLVLNKV